MADVRKNEDQWKKRLRNFFLAKNLFCGKFRDRSRTFGIFERRQIKKLWPIYGKMKRVNEKKDLQIFRQNKHF